ncbi:hypothetical protein ACGFIW_01340 [Micromonospora sp. NPDC048935]|uniref:hypothetical protein n=1 Tax=Micromonospora sp. NPDC048935 TaxID=3364262 RepID=UPI00371476E7
MTSQPATLPPSTQHQWPDPEDGPWLATLAWQVIDGRPECTGLTLAADGRMLTASVVRKIPVADWIAEDRARLAPTQPAIGGLRASTVERLKTAAEVYQRAKSEGLPPTKAVAAHYGISHGGASNLISRARSAGLLPPTSPGVSTG